MRARELRSMQVGEKIAFTEGLKAFFKDYAWEGTTIGGKLTTEHYAMQYMARKAIGMGLPYEAWIERFIDDVTLDENKEPGAEVKFKVGDFVDSTIVSHKELRRVS
jgi:hypothetical protein